MRTVLLIMIAGVALTLAACASDVQKTAPEKVVGIQQALEVYSILGDLYHDDFDAEHGVDVNGSSRVTQWENQTSDGDAFPGVIDAGDRASWAMYDPEYTESRPLYSATSFNGHPGVTSDHIAEQLGETLSAPIVTGKRPYVWVVFTDSNPHESYGNDFVGLFSPDTSSIITAGSQGQVYAQWRCDDDVNVCSEVEACHDTGVPTYPGGGIECTPSSSGFDAGRHLVEIGFTVDGTGSMVIDGVNKDDTGDYSTAGAASQDLTGLWIFGSPWSSIGLKTTIARVIVAGDQPSSQQLSDMRSSLSDKYDLGL